LGDVLGVHFSIEWRPRELPQMMAPNPAHQAGIDVVLANAGNGLACRARLPYPMSESGVHIVTCTRCDRRVGVSAIARADDPRSITIPCKFRKPLPPMA
jgi:hypothetical protein